jgi:Ca2+:H+ antiporter
VPYLRSDAAPGAGDGPTSATTPDPPGSGSPRASVSRTDGREEGAPGAEPRSRGPRLALSLILVLLFAGGTASAFVSDWFVNGLTPTISQLHLSQAFAGLVIVAIAGNAVENAAGIALAWKGRSDLAISVVKNSVAQIAAFLFPLLVLISFALKTTLTFSLAPVYIGALLLTTLALAQVTGDGEAAEFEGWALIALYVILGTLTLYE